MPRPPAAVDFGSGVRFRNHGLKVLTGGRGLDGTVLLRSERAAQKPTEEGVFGDGFGHGFENSITKDSLAHAELNEYQEAVASREYLLRTTEKTGVRPLGSISNEDKKYLWSESNSGLQTDIDVGRSN